MIALGTVAAVLAAMATNRVPPDLALIGGMLVLVVTGVVGLKEAVSGFGNEGMLTVAVLFIVAAAMQRSGAMTLLTRPLLGAPTTTRGALLRMSLPISGISGFINNTPLVAMSLPVVVDWAKRIGLSPSRLLMPLSYATILGGTLTMIGTSTNVVVNGQLLEFGRVEGAGLPFFTPFLVGVPVLVAGILVLVLLAPRLLRDRVPCQGAFADPRRFTTEATVDAGGALDGAEVAVLRARGVNPVEIVRGSDLIPAPAPDTVLHAGDRLVLAGPATAIIALGAVPGLTLSAEHHYGVDDDAQRSGRRHLYEVVISDRSPVVGEAVGTGAFRRRYQATIVALSRQGEAVSGARHADWVLRPGDSALVEAGAGFASHPDRDRDFWMLDRHDAPDRRPGAAPWLALAITAAMCLAAATGWVSMLVAAIAAALAIIATRLLSVGEARSAIDMQVVIAIGASFALGAALESSGAARWLAGSLLALGGDNPWVALALIYLVTAIVTELITNNAAAVLILPIALATADRLQVDYMPFAMAVMFAASASFMTPIGYATNLMVMGPGGYRLADFLRLGGVLQVVVGVVTVALAPVVWPFIRS